MNNLEHSGERLLRDKLLQHEFAADEQAWEKMNELLATHYPPAPLTPIVSTTGKVVWFTRSQWLITIVVVALVGWWILALGHLPVAETSLLEKTADKADISTVYLEKEAAPVMASTDNHIANTSHHTRLAKPLSEQTIKNKLNPKEVSANKNTPVFVNNSRLEKDGSAVVKLKKTGRNAKNGLENQLHNKIENPIKNPVSPAIIIPSSDPATNKLVPGADSLANIQAVHSDQPSNAIFSVLPSKEMAISGQPAKPRGTVAPWTHRERRVQVGVVAGGQLAYVRYDPLYNKKFGGSPTFGLSASCQITSRWAVQADLLYRMVPYYLATNFGQSALDANGQYQYWQYSGWSNDLEFIEMPLLAKRTFLNGKANLLMGVRPAFVRPVHITASRGTNVNNASAYDQEALASFSPTFNDGVRRFDLAFTLGGELRIWRNLWIHARISQGIFDLTHDDFFQNTRTDLTTDAHLSLRYYFLSF